MTMKNKRTQNDNTQNDRMHNDRTQNDNTEHDAAVFQEGGTPGRHAASESGDAIALTTIALSTIALGLNQLCSNPVPHNATNWQLMCGRHRRCW